MTGVLGLCGSSSFRRYVIYGTYVNFNLKRFDEGYFGAGKTSNTSTKVGDEACDSAFSA